MSTTDPTTHRSSLAALTVGALGVVFGDIGTSPLYAFKEAFASGHGLPLNEANIVGVLSLMFWAVTLVVSVKYVGVVLRFDNNGEGGILALLAYATQRLRDRPELAATAGLIAIGGASLFYGDAVITPAISVLSAVEGLSVAAPRLEHWVVPTTIGIIVALFAVQSRGTGSMGRLFGPITILWFLVLAALGVRSIIQSPEVLIALDPSHALNLAWRAPGLTFLTLGAVFLAVTGAEALYADMGHFGRKPITLAWFILVFPCLMLNYFGQGALVLRDAEAIKSPLYLLAPSELVVPLLILATAATVIASQATISGAFSVTQQASRLGYLPRITVEVTSDVERGQIYISRVNWLLLIFVVALVIGFGSSSKLAAAYGIAVSLTMLLETALIVLVATQLHVRGRPALVALLIAIGVVELLFVAANATKFLDGGWLPLACGAVVFTALTTWKRVGTIIRAREIAYGMPMQDFLQSLKGDHVTRVPGTAVYLSQNSQQAPTTLLHNLKHNKVIHQRMIFLTLSSDEVPYVSGYERTEVEVLERGAVYRVTLHYGFREDPDVPRELERLARHGIQLDMMETTFFLGRTTVARAERRGWFTWRRDLYRWMQRNTPSSAEYFKLPPSRVVELGTQITI